MPRSAATPDMDLLQGTLDLLVLKTLAWGSRHGYGIARWIHSVSDNDLVVEDRALYLSLHRLEAQGLVASEWGLSENNRRAKYYNLSPDGRRQLKMKATRWGRYTAAVAKVLAADAGGA